MAIGRRATVVPSGRDARWSPFRELVMVLRRIQTQTVPCLLGCFALSFPRLVILVVWLTTSYLDWAYETKIWPVLGFLFAPTTTLAYAFAMHYGDRHWTPIGIAAMVTALLIDLGLLGTSHRARRKPPDRGREIVVEGRRVG
jgi:hypothetical protein